MKKIAALSIPAAAYLASAFPAFGVTFSGSLCPTEPSATGVFNFNPLCRRFLSENLLGNILNIVFIVTVVIALAFLIYGGIKWITSGGDKTKVEGARNTIVAALIGLVLVFLAYFILQLLFRLFGLEFGTGSIFAELNIFKP